MKRSIFPVLIGLVLLFAGCDDAVETSDTQEAGTPGSSKGFSLPVSSSSILPIPEGYGSSSVASSVTLSSSSAAVSSVSSAALVSSVAVSSDVSSSFAALSSAIASSVTSSSSSVADQNLSDEDNSTYIPVDTNDTGLKSMGNLGASSLQLSTEAPISGEAIALAIALDDAVSIAVSVVGEGCGSLSDTNGTSPFELNGTVATAGSCDITVVATFADGSTQTVEGRFLVTDTDLQLPPITIAQSIWDSGEMPTSTESAKTGTQLPLITEITGPQAFVNGGTSQMNVQVDANGTLAAMLIKVAGYDGHYFVPAYGDESAASFQIEFDADYFDKNGSDTLDIAVMAIDNFSQISAEYNLTLQGTETGYGDVKVSISWDTLTDVDLHIIDPNNNWTFYGDLQPGNGSSLDLDSNPDCYIDSINNENIFWSSGTSVPGTYTVIVHMYNDCGIGYANGTLTMTYSGRGSPRTESWRLGGTDSNQTYTFEHGGSSYNVSGSVFYEDYPVTVNGPGEKRLLPARFADVEVVRADDMSILGEGSTNAAGYYTIGFNNDDTTMPEYFIRVKAASENFKQRVEDRNGSVYTFQTDTRISVLTTPDNVDYDLTITGDADGAAMNIFDVGIQCHQYAAAYGGKKPRRMAFVWEAGQPAIEVNGTIVPVSGSTEDPDAYDDLVIARAYGHFITATYSQHTTSGAYHAMTEQVEPSLAWVEGWATFFAGAALNRSYYADANATGLIAYTSLENLAKEIPLGNENDTLNGKLSEAVVAGVLWDLHDTTNETNDTMQGNSLALWRVYTDYFNDANLSDRGAEGIDLVDFLDGWFCLGYEDEGDDPTKGVQGIVTGIHKLSYDFMWTESCPQE